MASTVGQVWQRYRAVPLIYRITLAFVLGSAAGIAFGERMVVVEPFGDLFLQLLNMLVIPIIVFTLLTGIRHLSPAQLGKIGGTTVGLYAVTDSKRKPRPSGRGGCQAGPVFTAPAVGRWNISGLTVRRWIRTSSLSALLKLFG